MPNHRRDATRLVAVGDTMQGFNRLWAGCPLVNEDALRAARKGLGLSRSQLARATGINQHRLTNLEGLRGSRWRATELEAVARVLGVPAASLTVVADTGPVREAVAALAPDRRAALVERIRARGTRQTGGQS